MCERSITFGVYAILTVYRAVTLYVSISIDAKYTCAESQGAVLVIKSPAHHESIFRREPLQKYVRSHYCEWYAYAKGILEHSIDREQISLITGWAKTSADWKAVVFTRSSTSYWTLVGGRALGVAGVELRGEMTQDIELPEIHCKDVLYSQLITGSTASGKPKPSEPNKLSDPSDPDMPIGLPKQIPTTNIPLLGRLTSSGSGELQKDQCIFLKRCMMMKHRPFKKMVTGAEAHQLLRQEDGRSGQSGEGLVAAQKDDSTDEDDWVMSKQEVGYQIGYCQCRNVIFNLTRRRLLIHL